MAITLDDSIRVGQQKNLDAKYDNDGLGYTSVADCMDKLKFGERSAGQVVNILGVEYWWLPNATDLTLEPIEKEALLTPLQIIDIIGDGSTIDPIYLPIQSVNGEVGIVVLDTSNIEPTIDRNYVTDAELILINDNSGINTGDQDLTPYATNENLDLKVDKVTGERLINALEITKLADTTGVNTGDQDLSGKVDKVTGERLINASEITKLTTTSGTNTGDDIFQYNDLTDFPLSGEDGKIYIDLDTGKLYRWNSLSYIMIGGADITVADNTGLAISISDELSTIFNTTIGDSVNSVPVGGAIAQAASFWKTKTLVEVLNTILFPEILASILTNKFVSLNLSGNTGILEIGTSLSGTLTASFNRGAIKNGNGTTNPNPLVGEATQYTFTGTGISPTSQLGNTLNIPNIIEGGGNSWTVTVNHSAGTGDYFNNYGTPGTNLNASRVAGTSTATSSPTVTGVYPLFFGKSLTLPIAGQALINSGIKSIVNTNNTLNITFNATDPGEYLWFAIPESSTNKTKWFVTDLNNGNIGLVPQDLFPQNTVVNINSPSDFWNNISYRFYISGYKTTTSGNMQIQN